MATPTEAQSRTPGLSWMGPMIVVIAWCLGAGAWAAEGRDAEAELRVCGAMSNPPFFYTDDGTPKGVEHDILAAFAQHKGIAMRLVEASRGDGALKEARCDVVASTITRTPDREKRMDFSAGYFPVRIVVVEKRSSITTRPDALRGKTMATMRDSTYLRAVEPIGDIQIHLVERIEDMFQAVSNGEADFLACDSAIVLTKLGDYPDLHITVPLSERAELAFVLRTDSALTRELSDFITDARQSGVMAEILTRYFDAETVDMILGD